MLAASPDLLLVKWTPTAGCNILFCVAHALHKGHPEDDKLAWWTKLRNLLQLHGQDSTIISLLDANAAVGSICDQTTGPLNPEEEDTNGAQLRLLAGQFGLFLPSTFEGIHSGPSPTWFSAAATTPTGTRNDFILVPDHWISFALQSSVLPDLDIAQPNVDHVALLLIVSGKPAADRASRPKLQQPRIDWPLVRKCKDHEVWATIFKDLPQPSWNIDVHSHWSLCHQALCDKLRTHFPLRHSRPKKPYVSDETWKLRNQKCALRRQVALRAHLCPRLDILVPFQTWRTGVSYRQAFLKGLCWLLRCQAAHLRDKPLLQGLQAQLRVALHHQRNQFLEIVADEADKAPGDQLYAQLRRAGFCSTRRQRFRPLPMVLDAQGDPAADLSTLRSIWRDHFSAIEGGRNVSHEELLQLCINSEIQHQHFPEANFLQKLPTLSDLESTMRACKAHKAAGTDNIVPELLKHASRWVCHWLAPLLAKCSLYITEPIQWRGGVLHELYKGKGPLTETKSFRGILVSSHLATRVFIQPFDGRLSHTMWIQPLHFRWEECPRKELTLLPIPCVLFSTLEKPMVGPLESSSLMCSRLSIGCCDVWPLDPPVPHQNFFTCCAPCRSLTMLSMHFWKLHGSQMPSPRWESLLGSVNLERFSILTPGTMFAMTLWFVRHCVALAQVTDMPICFLGLSPARFYRPSNLSWLNMESKPVWNGMDSATHLRHLVTLLRLRLSMLFGQMTLLSYYTMKTLRSSSTHCGTSWPSTWTALPNVDFCWTWPQASLKLWWFYEVEDPEPYAGISSGFPSRPWTLSRPLLDPKGWPWFPNTNILVSWCMAVVSYLLSFVFVLDVPIPLSVNMPKRFTTTLVCVFPRGFRSSRHASCQSCSGIAGHGPRWGPQNGAFSMVHIYASWDAFYARKCPSKTPLAGVKSSCVPELVSSHWKMRFVLYAWGTMAESFDMDQMLFGHF